LNNASHPEKAYQSCNKQEHFPFSDLSAGKVAFGKNYADNKKYGELHQLKYLKPRDVINEF